MNDLAGGFHPPQTTLSQDVSPARWVEESLRQTFGTVGSLIPAGFPSYARLFHPARKKAWNEVGQPVRWAEVAAWSGRIVHPWMAFEGISSPREGFGTEPPPWAHDPAHGSLDEEDAAAVAAFLAGFTRTHERCYFAVWDGYGQFSPGAMSVLTSSGGGPSQFPPREIETAQRIRGVGRDYLLYSGPLSAVISFFVGFWHSSPSIWWPEDRAWCVATDIDLDSTYVGGAETCIQALQQNPIFEALPIELDASTYFTADTLNISEH